MLAFYIVSLGFAAGTVGSTVRHLFSQFGYIPGFFSGLYVTFGAGCLYSAVQLLYLTILRAYQPTRTARVYATEAASNLAVVLVLPSLLGASFPGLPEDMARVAPVLYLGVFGAVHLMFKLASFYAALTGELDPDRPILVWFGSALALSLLAGLGFSGWQGSIASARQTSGSPEMVTAASLQYAVAREVQEGATLSGAMERRDQPVMALRFANLQPGLREGPPVGRVYATVKLEGRDTKVYQASTELYEDKWAEILVPSTYFPRETARYEVHWTRSSEPNWQRILGLRPVVYNLSTTPGGAPPAPSTVYLSGPSIYVERSPTTGLSLLVVVVDGLAADHLSLFGYERDATPSMDRLGSRAHLFPKTVARGATTDAGMAAMLTGRDPGALDAASPAPATLPEILRTAGFATSAFFEVAAGERYYDREWARGFEIFEERSDPVPSGEGDDDSGVTLSRARDWISNHRTVPFLCVIRLNAVAQLPARQEPAEESYRGRDGTVRDVDRFDSALVRADRQLGALFKYIRDYETRTTTCIVLTATYGTTFSPGEARKYSDVPSENVPLIVETPERRQLKYPREATLHDLGATMAGLARVRLPAGVQGKNLLQ